jgi:hypothetical protein
VDLPKVSNEGVACCDGFVVKSALPESSTNPRARLVESSRAAVTKGSWMSDEASRVGPRIETKTADCFWASHSSVRKASKDSEI